MRQARYRGDSVFVCRHRTITNAVGYSLALFHLPQSLADLGHPLGDGTAAAGLVLAAVNTRPEPTMESTPASTTTKTTTTTRRNPVTAL
ncbi:hypothetical protein Y032_0186g1066 [Ancylostoma ceylanicum]|uniref:Uncharacterized protein n=1 Tax=Ancylostoma ceylanicum TaxID=53326 RepID=A0A016SQY2_9BILA|nr:hypothetical protein Y032_0186g1066 [Ancylostoma ceylanicum]